MAFGGTGTPRDEELAPGEEVPGLFEKSGDVLRQGFIAGYQVLERCLDEFPIRLMCRGLQVSANGCYDWSQRLPRAGQRDNQRLAVRIREMVIQAAQGWCCSDRTARR